VLSTEFEKAAVGFSSHKALSNTLQKSNDELRKENEELSSSIALIQSMGDNLQIVVETITQKLSVAQSANQKSEFQIKVKFFLI
jgi:hypothetical protein